ncbi:MAG: HD domain-containing protein [Candidatus Daviesbacteria bacterium]|nr:HD domain-containing protein [Candidatus Daviesbacteria bacterium]
MNYTLPTEVKNILNKLQQSNFQIYIVGGVVRDLLMESASRLISDWDFATDAKPEEILKLFPDGFYDNKFGTVGIPSKDTKHLRGEEMRLHLGGGIFEITTMRKEGIYKDHRHPVEVSWTKKIEEDLARRDFTINAMALDTTLVIPRERSDRGNLHNPLKIASLVVRNDNLILVDPFNGQQDLKNKLIRAVGDPNKRFQEDALRLIRAIRIATELEFEIDPKTLQAIETNAHLIKKIAFERIRDELFKILSSSNPYAGIVKLKSAGILQIILPELEECFGIVQKGPKHDRVYDIGEHSLLTLKYTAPKDPLVRFAALLHDIGKTKTVKIEPDGNVTFYNHDVVGGKLVLEIAKRFNLSNKQTDKLYRLIRWHLFTVDEQQTDSAIRRFIKNVGIENIEDMIALRIGDRLGGGTQKAVSWRMEEFQKRIKEVLKKPFSITDLKVNGNDVMKELNLKPGPKVGEILQKLFEEVLENSSKNKRDYLLKKLKSLK